MGLSISTFWALTILMVLVACLFVVIPFIKFDRSKTFKGLHSGWYKSRLAELKEEYARGQFNEEQYEAAVTELKLTAMGELNADSNPAGNAKSAAGDQTSEVDASNANKMRMYLLVAMLLLIVTVFVGYRYYGEQEKLQQWQTALERMPALTKQVLSDVNARPSDQDLRDFSLGLRTKLSQEPKAIGWMLLGRNLELLGDIDGAIDAFDKSYRLEPNNTANAISLATSLQQRGEPGDYNRSIRLLKAVLANQPQNLTALILTAEGNMLAEQFEQALTGFKLAKRVMPATDFRVDAVNQRIAFLSQQEGVEQQPDSINTAKTAEATRTTTESSDNNNKLASGTNITIEVTVAEQVNLDNYKALFVFAKQPNMAMPLAVKKIEISKELMQSRNLIVELTEQDVMVPTMSLANQPVVDVIARLSVDDAAPKQDGDLEAKLLKLALPSATSVKLDIN